MARRIVRLTGTVAVENADRFPEALRRLRAAYPAITWRAGKGSSQTPTFVLREKEERPEGSFRITCNLADGLAPRVIVEGGAVSGLLSGVEELIAKGGGKAAMAVATAANEQVPGLPFRAFWTFDHSTNWSPTQVGQQEVDGPAAYAKPAEAFLADYYSLIDFCSRQRVGAVIIHGFLSEAHGGEAAATDLCAYARQRGVRLIPVVTLGDGLWDQVTRLATFFDIGGLHVAGAENLMQLTQQFPLLFETVRTRWPNLWVSCDVPGAHLPESAALAGAHELPRGAIYLHTVSQERLRLLQRQMTRPLIEALPMQPHALRCGFAWNREGAQRGGREHLNARSFTEMAQLCDRAGLKGFSVWGGPSPYRATVELSYLAFARFSFDPLLSWERFLAEDAAPLFGGPEALKRFLSISDELEQNPKLPLARLKSLRRKIREHEDTDAAGRRWHSLGEQVMRRIYRLD